MIRHRINDHFLLFTQDAHAHLSAEMARCLGNDRFGLPMPFDSTVAAISMHDSGWPLHDDEPTLDPGGLPLHVLETPLLVSTRVWSESTRRAAERDAYAGLLVSLHVLRLSARWVAMARGKSSREIFELNKFQHRQIEIQEALRRRLGLSVEVPLELGLAEPGFSLEEDLLLFNFGLLRGMDALSLDVCCDEPVFGNISGIHPRPGQGPVCLEVEHPREFELALDPWPFGRQRIELEIPARRVSAAPFANSCAFLAAYRAAPVSTVAILLRAQA